MQIKTYSGDLSAIYHEIIVIKIRTLTKEGKYIRETNNELPSYKYQEIKKNDDVITIVTIANFKNIIVISVNNVTLNNVDELLRTTILNDSFDAL